MDGRSQWQWHSAEEEEGAVHFITASATKCYRNRDFTASVWNHYSNHHFYQKVQVIWIRGATLLEQMHINVENPGQCAADGGLDSTQTSGFDICI